MEQMRSSWTDERLDDLSHRVADGFNRVDEEIRSMRAEINARFDAQNSRFDARFDALQRTMLQLGGGMIATFVVGFAGLIAARI